MSQEREGKKESARENERGMERERLEERERKREKAKECKKERGRERERGRASIPAAIQASAAPVIGAIDLGNASLVAALMHVHAQIVISTYIKHKCACESKIKFLSCKKTRIDIHVEQNELSSSSC